MVRNHSLAAPIRPALTHDFLTGSLGPVAYGGAPQGNEVRNSAAALDRAAAISAKVILWIDIAPQPDGTLVALTPEPSADAPLTLEQVLTRFPGRKLILNFSADRPGMAPKIGELLEAHKDSGRVLIQSPEDGILKDLREHFPLWLYGNSQARMIQLKMLDAFLLASLAPLKGDVLVVHWTQETRGHVISNSIIEEGHRRLMPVIVGPVNSKDQAQALRLQGVDAVVSSDTSTLVDQAAR